MYYILGRWTFSCCCLAVVWSLPLGEYHTRFWPVSSSAWYWPCWPVQGRSKSWQHEQELQPTCTIHVKQSLLSGTSFPCLTLFDVHVPYILTDQIHVYNYTVNSIKDSNKKKIYFCKITNKNKKSMSKLDKTEIIFTYLINPHVWVRWNDSSSREINSLSRQVSTETTLFTFQPLHKPSCHFLWLK